MTAAPVFPTELEDQNVSAALIKLKAAVVIKGYIPLYVQGLNSALKWQIK